MPDREHLEALAQRLADEGKLMEAGWIICRIFNLVPTDASSAQLEQMRRSFMHGAQHLFIALITMPEQGDGPPVVDTSRISSIHKELNDFHKATTQPLT